MQKTTLRKVIFCKKKMMFLLGWCYNGGMCRLFGFRSVIKSQVHTSLVHAENALEAQSVAHPDGWGVAYYIMGSPHVIKSEGTAIKENLFKKVSGIVSSETVLAHIRSATLGNINILNTHPFQFGHWVFAHNGNIKEFDKHKTALLDLITQDLKRFILGDTDSEILFYIMLSELSTLISLKEENCPVDKMAKAIQRGVQKIVKIVGNYAKVDNAGNTENYLTFVMTNKQSMIAHQGGKHLFYSTYKNKCSDRDICSSFSPECEAPSKNGSINHLIFSSEPLSGDNIWLPMNPGQLIGVDGQMKLTIFN